MARDKEEAEEHYKKLIHKDPTKSNVDSEMVSMLQPLEHVIGHFAIRKIRIEVNKAREVAAANDINGLGGPCNCSVRVKYLLPCYHQLMHINNGEIEIRIDPSLVAS